MKKPLLIFILAIVVTALIYSKQSTPNNPKKYIVGVLLPITGEISEYGESARNAVLLQDDPNSPIQIRIEDTGLKPNQTISALRKIESDASNNDQEIGAILSYTSNETLAVCPVTEQDKILLLSSGSSPSISDCGNLTYSNFPSDNYQAKIIANKVENIPNLGILYINNDYGYGVYQEFKKNYTDKAFDLSFTPGKTDYRDVILKIKEAKIDNLILVGYPKENIILLKQLSENQIKFNSIYLTETFKDNTLISSIPDVYKNIIKVTAPISYSGKESLNFIDKYKETYNSNPTMFADYVYDNITIVKNILSVCKAKDYDCIKDYLVNVDTIGATGKINFNSQHSVQGKEYGFHVIEDGHFVVDKLSSTNTN